jgi:hypothetical protein
MHITENLTQIGHTSLKLTFSSLNYSLPSNFTAKKVVPLIGLQVIPAWLSCLPIRSDLLEAKIVHAQLCSLLERYKGR